MTSAQQNKLWFWGKMLYKDTVTLKGNGGRKLLVWGQLLEKSSQKAAREGDCGIG